jgi:hypothetical protein
MFSGDVFVGVGESECGNVSYTFKLFWIALREDVARVDDHI